MQNLYTHWLILWKTNNRFIVTIINPQAPHILGENSSIPWLIRTIRFEDVWFLDVPVLAKYLSTTVNLDLLYRYLQILVYVLIIHVSFRDVPTPMNKEKIMMETPAGYILLKPLQNVCTHTTPQVGLTFKHASKST